MKRYAIVLGIRPEFVKLSPLLTTNGKQGVAFTVVHTGQHFDEELSRIFFDEMKLPRPDITLNPHGTTYSERFGGMLHDVTEALAPLASTLAGIVVLGDSNSTLAGGVAAARLRTPLFHIEGGLRSNDQRMPEEANRIVVDYLSDTIFTTEEAGEKNLLAEGVAPERIHFTGNLGIEALELFRHRIDTDASKRFDLMPKKYIVATIHRREHVTDPRVLERILALLGEVNKEIPVIFPMHPGTKKQIDDAGLGHLVSVKIVEPLGYFEFLGLVFGARGVITDSGGIQEETSHLGISCATVRDNTERPVTITLGSNKLFPSSMLSADAAKDVLAHLTRTDFKAGAIPRWDREVSARIMKHLA